MSDLGIKWIGSPNFGFPRGTKGRNGQKVIAIVDHIMEGTIAGTDAWFNDPKSCASSTFGVGKDGSIHQYIDLNDAAWANGGIAKPSWLLLKKGVNPNLYTISIEHEGKSGEPFTELQYQATLSLHRYLIREFNLPVNRDTIIGHYRIDSVKKAHCPGTGFPWDRLFKDLLKKGEDKVKVAILINSDDDRISARKVAAKFGNCAVYERLPDRSYNKDFEKAETPIVIGGSDLKLPNQIYCSGNTYADTAKAIEAKFGV